MSTNKNDVLAPLDLVSSHPWRRTVFTTYALSLSFFEAVVLDALVRGRGREALILADVEGVSASLDEQGAHRVGKDYEVEPVKVSGGIFHPKISVFATGEECHLLVGSGNLTFGGWGGNCEVLEHLHPTFAADAIEDAASFFDLMTVTERIRCGAADSCSAISAELRKSAQGKPRNGNIRLFHSLDLSIVEQIAQVVVDLGGAKRLIAAAPFWDDGSAIDGLCAAIGLDHLFLHAHPRGCVEGSAGANWPVKCRNKVQAIEVDLINVQGSRRLHGKLFEIICKRGRLVVSGSANGTAAALGKNHNIEACVARIQRSPAMGWTFQPADPPELQPAIEKEESDETLSAGVLRAVLEADELIGEVLVPKMSGRVAVSCIGGMGAEALGQTNLSKDQSFRITSPTLEELSWRADRLVVQVTDKQGRSAQGFVSVASYADITRRTGAIGRRLFALLSGTETPEDVAAILSWFYEDPERLSGSLPKGGGHASGSPDDSDDEAVIAVAALSLHNLSTPQLGTPHEGRENQNWIRFMEHIFSAFRQKREPLTRTNTGAKTETDEEQGLDPESAPDAEEAAIEQSLSTFEQLFALLLSDGENTRNLMVALDLTNYVCGRLQPEVAIVKYWLGKLIPALVRAGVPAERRDDVIATILMLASTGSEANGCRWAREYLLHLGVDVNGGIPSMNGVSGFRASLPQRQTAATVWEGMQKIRTHSEQTRAYMLALQAGSPSSGYDELANMAPEEWPILEAALASAVERKKILELNHWQESCPRCQISLPTNEVYKLQSVHVATAKNCCGRVILWTGE